MKISTVFFVLLASTCALATVEYKFPEIPCSWTFHAKYFDAKDPESFHSEVNYFVNGHHLKYTFSDFYKKKTQEVFYLLRPDLSNESGFIKKFFWNDEDEVSIEEENVPFEEERENYRPAYIELPFEGEYKSVENSELDGKKCKKYIEGRRENTLYVDEAGWPIRNEGYDDGDLSYYVDCSFSSKFVPLSEFKALTSIKFSDVRVFNAPTETYCTPDPSSESASSALTPAFSCLLFLLFIALCNLY